MQVSVVKISELSRKMTVHVSAQVVKEKIDARIKSLTREVTIDGFRPGKAPIQVVRKMYVNRVREEITGDLIQSGFFEAVQNENLNPAGSPQISLVGQPSDAEGFEYTANFEVYPEITLDCLEQMQIISVNAKIEDIDIDNMIESLKQQKKDWRVVNRSAKNGDQVTLDFTGVCEGVNFTNGKTENFKLTLGDGKMIAGFEDHLLGLSSENNKTFDIKFPEPYGDNKLSGKIAQFTLTICSIEEPILPELNAEFMQSLGVDDGDLDKFREQVQRNLNNELEQASQRQNKNNVMDALYAKINLNVPNVLIRQEIERLKEPYKVEAKRQKQTLKATDLPAEMFTDQAQRRVALGLIIAEIIKKNNIKVDRKQIHARLENIAKNYADPEDILKWYYADKKRLAEIEQLVLEEQAINWILGKAHIIEKTVSFNELTKLQNQG